MRRSGQPAAARRLRISIRAEDPELAAELRAMVAAAGHDVVDAADEADVVMQGASAGFAAIKALLQDG